MREGLYESLVTAALATRLENLDGAVASYGEVDPADQPHVLARHVALQVERALTNAKDPARRLELINGLLATLEAEEAVESPARHLERIAYPAPIGSVRMGSTRPATPLSEAALLTNAHWRTEPGRRGQGRARHVR